MQSKYTIPPPIGAVFAFYTTPKVDGIHLTATGAIADIAGLYTRHRHKKGAVLKGQPFLFEKVMSAWVIHNGSVEINNL